LFVVVVAVDARWVSRALKAYYPDLIADREMTRSAAPDRAQLRVRDQRPADARDYLEKIFQLPYWVREMDEETSTEFVDGLTRPLAEGSQGGPKRKQGTGETSRNPGSGQDTASSGEQGPKQRVASAEGGSGQESAPNQQGSAAETKVPSQSEAKPTREFAQMTLSDTERKVIAAFAPFVGGSPRRAKRYVNLYLLLKTSLEVGGTQIDDRLAQRALMALLAIVTGLGRPIKFFDVLKGLGPQEQRLEALAEALSGGTTADGSHEACNVIRKLIKINHDDGVDEGQEIISALRKFAPTVRRYSF
jgi:hypothetical protein